MELRLLGPIELEGPNGIVAVVGKKERALLTYLALRANEVVSEAAVVEAIWAGEPPPSWSRTLQTYVSRVRKACADADPGGLHLAIESVPGGWVLRVAADVLDVARVDRLVATARELRNADDHVGAALTMSEAQRCWRGQALGEFGDAAWATADVVRLEELRMHLVEERIDLELMCGRHGAVVAELDAQCTAHPLRERLWGQLIVALYRCGRQAEALRAYQTLRTTLRDELGIEPCPDLVRIEADVLQQSVGLDWTPRVPVEMRAARSQEAGALLTLEPPEELIERPADTGVVTLLFTDIVESTAHLDRMGDDEFETVRRAHFRMLREAVTEAGGSEVKRLGDGIMAVFASAVDAVGCAVSMQRSVARRSRRSEAPLELRIGMHCGEPIRDDDDFFGMSVVVARRLCDRAGPGEILTSRLVADFVESRGHFTFEALGDIELKGVGRPVPATRVVWEDEPARPLPTALEPLVSAATFVGREREQDEIAAAWRRAQAGSLEVLLVAGEPGIGKTTLTAHLAGAAWAEGAIVLFGRCDEESLAPFQPFVEALAEYVDTTPPSTLRVQLGHQASDVALLLPGLGRVVAEVGDVAPTGAETERYRLFEAVPTFLKAIAEEAPVMLILDDLHWADRPTLQLLQHVIRRGSASSLLVLGTYRDTDLVRTHPMAETLAELRRADLITRLPLRGLSVDDVLAVVAGTATPDAADGALAKALWEETEGSPLFLREIVRHLAETGVIGRDELGRWRAQRRVDQLGIPEGVREVIGRRLTRLSEEANTALRAGAVMGRELRLDVLEVILDLSPNAILDALEEAAAAGVIDEVPGAMGRYAFTHALVRHALYDELSITRRVRTHQRIGEALEQLHAADLGPYLAELAHHFSQATVAGQAGKAIDYARRAGERARELVAFEDAARHFTDALEAAEDLNADRLVRADLLQALGESHWLAGRHKGARAAFHGVAELVGPHDGERFAAAALGHAGAGVRSVWADIGVPNHRSIELLEQALAAMPPQDSATRAHLLACLAQELYFVSGTTARRFELSAEAVAMARRVGNPETLAVVLVARNLAIHGLEGMEERALEAGEAAEIAHALGDERLEGRALFHRFTSLHELGDLIGATRDAERSRALLEHVKDPAVALLWPLYEAGSDILEGRFAEAQDLVDTIFRRGQESHDPNAFVMFASAVCPLRFFQGRINETLGVLDAFRPAFPGLDTAIASLSAVANAEVGFDSEATMVLDTLDVHQAAEDTAGGLWSYLVAPLARACWRLGDDTRAADLYELLLPYADTCAGIGSVSWGCTRLPLAWSATTCGWYEDAEVHFEAALDVHKRHGWVAPLVVTQVDLAEMLVRRSGPGDTERASALLHDALATATDLGMAGQARAASELLARLGTAVGARQEPFEVVRWRDRARARLTAHGRSAVARWTKGHSDEELVRRFGGDTAQRALLTSMARSFQPAMAGGFSGDIVLELLPPDSGLEPNASDWWTLEVRGRKAVARRGRSSSAATSVHVTLADFVRLSSGEMPITDAILGDRMEITGDVLLAARLPELFGAVPPVDLEPAER